MIAPAIAEFVTCAPSLPYAPSHLLRPFMLTPPAFILLRVELLCVLSQRTLFRLGRLRLHVLSFISYIYILIRHTTLLCRQESCENDHGEKDRTRQRFDHVRQPEQVVVYARGDAGS